MKKQATVPVLALVSLFLVAGCGEDLTMPVTGTIYGDLAYEDETPASGLEILVEGTGLRAVSDAAGRFVINGVLAVDDAGIGKYYVVRGAGFRNRDSMGFVVFRLKVKGSQSYSVGHLTVKRTGSLAGRVTLQGESDHSGVKVRIDGTSLEAISRADGTYRIDHVPAHKGYTLVCNREGFHEAVLTEMPGVPGELPISVISGQTTTLETTGLTAEN